MSSGLSSSRRSKSKVFKLKDIEVLVDGKKKPWFKQAYIGRYLGIAGIITSTSKLSEEDMKTKVFLQVEGRIRSMDAPRKDAQDNYMFIPFYLF